MIYLDHAATSFPKPAQVRRAVAEAMVRYANPGRSGHGPSMAAGKAVYQCRQVAGELFGCQPEQVTFTGSCTQGLNMAIRTIVKPGARVVISGFEHNAVVRPLYALGADIRAAGRRLFDPVDTLEAFRRELALGVDAAVFTHASNVFGYILPIEQLSKLCREAGVPFVIDAAQTAGSQPLSLKETGADFIAMPGHKGLLGPQGTGLLLCGRSPDPLLFGGTGSQSELLTMPEELPDRAEAGTLNVPGIAGLAAGLALVRNRGISIAAKAEREAALVAINGLKNMGIPVFSGENQGGTFSFLPPGDCEETGHRLWKMGIAVRAGLHCAPLAHRSAGTLKTGTVRVSFGHDCNVSQSRQLLHAMDRIVKKL